ncbi:MAG TPA: hypothetical protein VFQ67_09665 [Allosphingosinicella sp.]|jgi:hypothetical protein|nr:hypothetical protein [Allosphingosinicella sp.]
MTDDDEPFEEADWLTAPEALRRVSQIMNEFQAQHAIADRARDGLVRTRAERFVKHRQVLDDVELPKDFWWAGANAALKQNWATGDFSTWINRTLDWKAYGVRFHRRDIAKMLPAAPIVSALAATVDATEALKRLCAACTTRDEAARTLFRYARVGAIKASARFIRTEDEDGEAAVETDRLLQIDDWRGIDEPTLPALASGNLTGSYRDNLRRSTVEVEIIGLRFDADGVDQIASTISATEAFAAEGRAVAKGVGRPRAEWWDDLLIEIFRRLWEENWTPRTQAELVEAMHDWLGRNPGDDPEKPREAGDTALKARAKKLFDVLDLGHKCV